jgi:hypothetical protein
MAIQRLSDAQLRKLTPEERIKYLRALEEEQKKEAEEVQRKAQEEIQAAEKLISESEEEIEEEQEERERRNETKKEPEKEVSLEEKLAKEQAQSASSGQYRTDKPYERPGTDETTPLYRTLEDAASDLDRLYRTSNWSREDEERYRDAKEQVQRAGQYQLQSDRLKEDLGLAQDMLNRLHYKR